MNKAKIAVITIGHRPYWVQFPGLKEDLIKKTSYLINMIKPHSDVYDFGFIDNISTSHKAIKNIKKQDVDGLFVMLSTYVTSSVVSQFALYLDIPIILIALQPDKRLDYQKTTTYTQLYNDDICALPEICGVLNRLNRPAVDCIVGNLYDDLNAKEEIRQWCMALNAVNSFKYSTIGYLGHTYEGMYDMHTDPTAFSRTFKSHVKMLEMCELVELENQVSQQKVDEKLKEIKDKFIIANPSYDPLTKVIDDEDLIITARVSVALDELINNHNLIGLAYYYSGLHQYQKVGANMIIGNSLLISNGIPLAGEADLKTCAALIILNAICGGGSFAELHPIDHVDNVILVGHDGPHNINISNSKPILRKLDKFHGKLGNGVSIEFSIKTGPVTLLSISLNEMNQFQFVVAEGESIEGEIPSTGNTNTRCKFDYNIYDFVKNWSMAGSTHHLALAIGHHGDVIDKIAKVFNITFKRII